MAAAEHESDLKHTIDTPYLALTGKLWVVCCEGNWPCYNGTTLYFGSHDQVLHPLPKANMTHVFIHMTKQLSDKGNIL